jgi:hypothetical protein
MPDAQLVFIIGTGRCGSTMTHEVLARHHETGFISNIDANLPALNLGGRFNSTVLRFTPQGVTQRDHRLAPFVALRLRFGPAEPYDLFSRHVSVLLSESNRDLTADDATPWLRERLTRFFDRRIASQGKQAFLCKLSGWPRARLLHEVFPEARFVHVVRDGRAVAESMLGRPWWSGFRGPEGWQYGPLPDDYQKLWEAHGRSYVALAGVQWMLMMDAFNAARAEVGDERWLEVRFEDLVAAPRTGFAEILRFAGLTWTTRFEGAFSKYRFVPERRDEYRETLGKDQLGLLDEIMASHLRARGYDAPAR